MPSSCTLLSPVFDLPAVLETVELNAEGFPVTVTGPRDRWDTIEVAFNHSRLKLTSLHKDKDDERYRRAGLAIFNFFMIVPTDDIELNEFLKCHRALQNRPLVGTSKPTPV